VQTTCYGYRPDYDEKIAQDDGAMAIAALVCPSPCSNAILGAAVLGVGIAQLIRARK